jgi:hypothetical protein
MSRHEWFRHLPEHADMVRTVPSHEHVDAKGFKRTVEVWDQRGAIDALADLEMPNINLLGREIYWILSGASDCEPSGHCAVCRARFTLARLPVCYLYIWPMPPNYWDDYVATGVCSSCAARSSFLWTDALAVADRVEEFFVGFSSSRFKKP